MLMKSISRLFLKFLRWSEIQGHIQICQWCPNGTGAELFMKLYDRTNKKYERLLK